MGLEVVLGLGLELALGLGEGWVFYKSTRIEALPKRENRRKTKDLNHHRQRDPITNLEAQILSSRPNSQPGDPNLILKVLIPASPETQILYLRSKSQPRGLDPNLQAQIPVKRPNSQPQG